MTYQLIEKRIHEDCGCEEEEFIHDNGAVCIIHFEPNGDGELSLDFGDWEHQLVFPHVKNMNELRTKSIEYLNSLPKEK